MAPPGDHRPDGDFSTPYKRLVLGLLTLVYAFNFIDRQILVILQEPIKAEMGLSDGQLGFLSGFTFAVIYVTAGLPLAAWADRANRRNIIAGALAVWSGMTALSGLVQNYGQLLLARLGVGLGEAGGTPPAHSLLSDYFEPERRATALAVYSSGIYLGILFGFAFGGLLAEALGWRSAFVAVGLPGVGLACLLLLLVREPLRGRWDPAAPSGSASQSGIAATLRHLRTRPSFIYLALAGALTSFVSYGNGNFMPSFLIRHHGMAIADVGLVLALASGVSGAIGTFLGGYLGDRLGRRDRRWYPWLSGIGVLIAFPPYLYVLLSEHTGAALTTLFALSVCNTLWLGPTLAMSHACVPAGMRAMTSAVLFFVLNMIGLGLGPLLTGLGSDLLEPVAAGQNLRYAMIATASITPLAAGLFFVAARWLPGDLANTAAAADRPAPRTSDREPEAPGDLPR